MNWKTIGGIAGGVAAALVLGTLLTGGEAEADKTLTLMSSQTTVHSLSINYIPGPVTGVVCAEARTDAGPVYTKCVSKELTGAALTRANDLRGDARTLFNILEGL